jgi:ankyrin repeat protein
VSHTVVHPIWPILLVAALLPGAAGENNRDLLDAVRAGDKTRVKNLLDKKAAVTAATADGTTALMHATLLGDVALLRLLLDAGADVNAANKAGATALMWAASDLDKVKLLLSLGAQVNARADSGHTPLLMAAGCADATAVVQLLLENGADAKYASRGYTALMAGAGNREVVRLLLARGADAKAANVAGWTALHAAALRGDPATMADLLARGANANPRSNFQDRTPLMWAAARGSPEMVRLLLKHKADVNRRESFNGATALIWASAGDKANKETVELLLAAGADTSARDKQGDTALAWAFRHGDPTVLDLLKQKGAADPRPDSPPARKRMGDDNTVARAVAASLSLLRKSHLTFMAKATERCVSCHHQSLPAVVFAAAEKHGYSTDRAASRQLSDETLRILSPRRERILQGLTVPDDLDPGYQLWGLAAAGRPRDDTTDALVHYLTRRQAADGHWDATLFRPPMNDGPFAATALGLRALKQYGPPGRSAEMDRRVGKAHAWLLAAVPHTTEDKSFQILGLTWARAATDPIRRAAQRLLAEQRPDGGWAQRGSMPSDAYATGQVLVALRQAGVVSGNSPAVRRGVKYLLRTQLDDGSWFVASRSLPIQPYFETGFPHGRSQFISCAATSWATLALIRLAERPDRPSAVPFVPD